MIAYCLQMLHLEGYLQAASNTIIKSYVNMRASLFAFVVLVVAVVVSTISRTASIAQKWWIILPKITSIHRTAMLVFELCVLFAIDLAILATRYYFGLLSSSYRTMISLPTKDAVQPDNEDANKNETRTTGKFNEGECAICLDSPQIDKSFPPCGHTYCFNCLYQWCKILKVCPTCNRRISFFHHGDGKMMCDLNQVQMRWKAVLKQHYVKAFITSGRQVFLFFISEWHTIILIITSMEFMGQLLFYALIKYGFM